MKRYRDTTEQIEANAIELRRKQTPTEAVLWERLRNRQIGGQKFRRQHPIGRYVLDFYCAEWKLAVELDGESHDTRQEYDRARTAWLEALGIEVLRFQNMEVVLDIDSVLDRIRARLPDPSPLTPLPTAGEGRNDRPDDVHANSPENTPLSRARERGWG